MVDSSRFKGTIWKTRNVGPSVLPIGEPGQPINIWKTTKIVYPTIAKKKASWPIYNEHLEDLNPYSNGEHSKRTAGKKKLRRVTSKLKSNENTQ